MPVKRGAEAHFQTQVVNLAALYGWNLRYHTYDSRRSAPGFPDLVLVRPPEILFWEVKSESGRIRPEQKEWIAALTACGLEAAILRPSDFDDIHARLSQGRHRLEQAA